MDAKARLVLPLSVREKLKIKPKDLILLSVSNISGSGENKKITLVLAKAPENSSGLAFSKNGSFLKKSLNKNSNKKEV